jgi:hypothetical protein
MAIVNVYNYQKNTYIAVDTSELILGKTNPVCIKKFDDGVSRDTPQNALYISNGELKTTGMATCVGFALRDRESNQCMLAHLDVFSDYRDVVSALKGMVNRDNAEIDLFNYCPPSGEGGSRGDLGSYKTQTILAVALQELGLLEKARMHYVSHRDIIKVTPENFSIVKKPLIGFDRDIDSLKQRSRIGSHFFKTGSLSP